MNLHNEQMLRQHIAQTQHVISPAGLGPYLYKLPRELRDQIFTQLLASRYPTFMRTSRAMKKEGETWIARESICRMNLGCLYGINCHGPSQEVLDTIQSVNIRIKGAQYLTTSTDAEHPELQVLDDLAGSAFLHKTCNISLELDEPLLYLGNVILNRLERLDGFEKVVLRVWTKWTGEPEITNFPKMYKAFESICWTG